MYKTIAKILIARLKPVVDYLVGPSQSAFIEGINILDNVILVHEIFKSYSWKTVSPRCFIKVDIRKAYDLVEWEFVRQLLMEFGIPTRMVNWIIECVSTVSNSLLINGVLSPKLEAKKGLRQGDLMSPYLFVLIMEYLNRTLKQLSQKTDFKHHPRSVSGLKANMEKSNLYIAGATDQLKQQLIDELHFAVGTLPSNLPPTQENTQDGGRSVQELPASGTSEYAKKAPIAWDTLCQSKSSGGLNIIQFEQWNRAAISKLLRAIAKKKDKMWVLWVHIHYIKNRDIKEMVTPKQATWLIRKMFDARQWKELEELKKCTKNGKFSIKQAYLSTMPQQPKIQWKSLVLLKNVIPRQQFILWMVVQNRLATTDRLAAWGIQVDPICQLCSVGEVETHKHLFFECNYASFVWQTLLHWTGIRRQIGTWDEEVQWMSRRVTSSSPKWAILGFVFTSVVYHIWMERNARRFQQQHRSNVDRTREIPLQLHIVGQSNCKWSRRLADLNSFPC
ncbi:uncharacterized protein LOC132057800 [Lycium ferocissimum]|uniref:uncharacterized protein LOC132057800 n=1 Tax=Lycium ferocissimum TaxID=112874 RepID=UPI0028161BFA|nr:uncharacterized protein LOC132057800 [Lycium ferocissimum]